MREAGIDKVRLTRLVKALRKCSQEMQDMGLSVYGSDGSGYLIHRLRPEHDEKTGKSDMGAVVAEVGFGFDGGGW